MMLTLAARAQGCLLQLCSRAIAHSCNRAAQLCNHASACHEGTGVSASVGGDTLAQGCRVQVGRSDWYRVQQQQQQQQQQPLAPIRLQLTHHIWAPENPLRPLRPLNTTQATTPTQATRHHQGHDTAGHTSTRHPLRPPRTLNAIKVTTLQ
eukprot:scaffold36691_cov18-Tisochrysis_lutea.AAC.1